MSLIAFVALVALAAAAPQGERPATTSVPILEYVNQFGGDGNYQFRFKTGNEINREEEGALKDVVVKNDNGQEEVKRVNVVRGVIRYPKDDGTFYELSYIADELGFRPVSSDIPSAPLP
ncbi:endocuticle structural glycoprotein SgAbd-2-like [Amphibalanus amphitrite]|uniref:endocuticle structural glycoprotein SgAbd-2-like n=1 Tax=Amphibalanus amphitrite TaxID=1232801 RepID=UPI001C8FEB76|nr:endocuticle structural glycoprotein SgAbd-2-like [Amphibalanus amphitrite]